jgi:transcription termination/antitermination protein NusG
LEIQYTCYSGYILIRLREISYLKNYLKGINGILNISSYPIDIGEFPHLYNIQNRHDSYTNEVFKIESRVVITEGPFINLNGIVKELYADRSKAKVLVSIFGRLTPIELDYSQISLLKKK